LIPDLINKKELFPEKPNSVESDRSENFYHHPTERKAFSVAFSFR